MNILHMKYAVEVARLGSLSRAAESLLTAQPNISRSIKELEGDLGITIFARTAKGMVPTPEGEEFLSYAESILSEINAVERRYRERTPRRAVFAISAPHAPYIAEAFSRFLTGAGDTVSDAFYRETTTARTVKYVQDRSFPLGIVRYPAREDESYKRQLEERGLEYELIAEFRYRVLAREDSPLIDGSIAPSELVEIVHADPDLPAPTAALPREGGHRRICLYDRASQFDLLANDRLTYLLASPVSRTTLERYRLIQLPEDKHTPLFRDLLIRRADYRLTSLDRTFITKLCEVKRELIRN